MTKKLLLFRHAKSDWESDARNDHSRPLAPRGIKAAEKMGRFLAATGRLPERVISSTANRAVETIELASAAGDWNLPVEMHDALYAATTSSVIRFLHQLPDEPHSIMLVGHEPVWSELTATLIDGGKIRFPTAAMAQINLLIDDWKNVRPGCGELSWLVRPKMLPEV